MPGVPVNHFAVIEIEEAPYVIPPSALVAAPGAVLGALVGIAPGPVPPAVAPIPIPIPPPLPAPNHAPLRAPIPPIRQQCIPLINRLMAATILALGLCFHLRSFRAARHLPSAAGVHLAIFHLWTSALPFIAGWAGLAWFLCQKRDEEQLRERGVHQMVFASMYVVVTVLQYVVHEYFLSRAMSS